MIVDTQIGREFVETGVSGIQRSRTWQADGEGAYFVRLAAGSRFPRHDHEGIEQILVVSGRVQFDDLEMTAGDFLKMNAGERHAAYAPEDTLVFVAHRGGLVIEK